MERLEDHDRGLAFDLTTLMTRRRAIRLFAGAGLATIVGCAPATTTTSLPRSTTGSTTPDAPTVPGGTEADCEVVPEETAGPFPGDGSNGANVLGESGVVRSDIRSSFGSASGVAAGVPLTINLTVQDASNGCAPLAGAAVYVWHCDRDGLYSLYSEGATDQNYLRGVQETDDHGVASFASIFPACYAGRWPHIHFEVYPSLAEATSAENKVATSQIALPQHACEVVYATDGYSQSVSNLSQVSLESDNVFADGAEQELGTVTGSVEEGFVVELVVPIQA